MRACGEASANLSPAVLVWENVEAGEALVAELTAAGHRAVFARAIERTAGSDDCLACMATKLSTICRLFETR